MSNSENEKRRKRILFSLCIVSGLASSIITFYLLSFDITALIATVAPQTIILLLFSRYKFEKYSVRLLLYIFAIISSVWFISGTILIQST